jgi:hypothetical protein
LAQGGPLRRVPRGARPGALHLRRPHRRAMDAVVLLVLALPSVSYCILDSAGAGPSRVAKPRGLRPRVRRDAARLLTRRRRVPPTRFPPMAAPRQPALPVGAPRADRRSAVGTQSEGRPPGEPRVQDGLARRDGLRIYHARFRVRLCEGRPSVSMSRSWTSSLRWREAGRAPTPPTARRVGKLRAIDSACSGCSVRGTPRHATRSAPRGLLRWQRPRAVGLSREPRLEFAWPNRRRPDRRGRAR